MAPLQEHPQRTEDNQAGLRAKDRAGSGPFLAIGITTAVLLVYHGIGLLVWGPHRLIAVPPWLITVVDSWVASAAACVAFFALGRFRVLRDPASYFIGIGFSAFTIGWVFRILSWPGLLPGNRAVISNLPSTGAVIGLWSMSALAIALLLSASGRRPRVRALGGRPGLWSAAGWLAAFVLANVLVVVFEQFLPAMVSDRGGWTSFAVAWNYLNVVMVASGLVLSARGYLLTGDILFGYTAFAQITLGFFSLVLGLGGRRYGLLTFIDRLLCIPGFWVMAFGLLTEYVHLFRREQLRNRQLHESEVRFRSLFETSQDAILLVNQETGRFLGANPAACRLYGYSREEFLTLKITDVSAEPEKTETAVRGSVADVPFRLHRKKDGAIFPVEISGGYFTVDGLRLHTAFIRDITGRKKMEDALRESETKLRAILDSSRDAIGVSKDGMHAFVNPAYVSLFGYDNADELIGMPTIILVAPEDRPFVMEMLEKGLAGEPVPSIYELTALKKDGGRFRAEASVSRHTVRGEEFAVAVLRDITERKRLEEALRLSEEKFAKLFATNPAALAVTRVTDGLVMEVNETWEKMSGYRQDEVLGQTTTSLGFWPTPEARAAAIKELREKGSVVTSERTIVKRSGERVVVLGSTALLNFGGEEAVLSSWLDIDDRKRAERDLDIANNKLEQQTRELQTAYDKLVSETRQREQMEAQLRQAQKMEALGTLAGGIAHDFNNILAVIIGFAEVLEEEPPSDSGPQEDLSMLLESAMRGKDLIKQMLTFSRQTEQEKRPVSLAATVTEATTFLRASIPVTIGIDVHLGHGSGSVLGDPVQLQQVVINLCTNAAFAMRDKGGTLTIKLGEFNASDGDSHGITPGSYVTLAVRDTGEGISPEHVEKIFDPFFTTKKPGEGTGLGLSVVHGIVTSHGGYLTAESTPGKGSLFTVYLPMVGEEAFKETATEEAVPTGHERILFVDDEVSLSRVGQKILEGLGYRVSAMTNSSEALALFAEDPSSFDLVITDQTMPEMTGIEFAHALRALRSDMPIILCTGYSYLVDAQTARAAGINAFAMKPLTKGEIARTVRNVLDV